MEQQQCTEWCWVASTLAVCRCFQDTDSPASQVDLANLVLRPAGPRCGCTNCNQPVNLAVALDSVHHDRDGPEGIYTVKFESLKQEIDAGHPVVVRVRLNDPAASDHAIVIYGYTDDGIALIADPMHAGDLISVHFEDFVSGTPADLKDHHGEWQSAYRTKKS
jgi:hypothetical protein